MGLLKELLSEYTHYFKATFARCLFLMTALVIMWRTEVLLGEIYWLSAIGIVVMIVEYIVTIIIRNGQEYEWVSPATFCYLICAVPGLWLQKLHQLGHLGTSADANIAVVPSTSIELDFSSDDWMLLSEQTMLVTIILSRWLLPKGKMTHNEVSQLLLLYLSLSSDIIDFLSIFSFTQVSSNETYCYVLLFWWTWALMQFTLVLTSTKQEEEGKNENDDSGDDDPVDEQLSTLDFDTDNSDQVNHTILKTRTSASNAIGDNFINSKTSRDSIVNGKIEEQEFRGEGDGSKGEGTEGGGTEREGVGADRDVEQMAGETESDESPKSLTLAKVLCSSELWSILVVIFLQDGPFIINRLVVMLHFKVFNYTIIFFICKNLLVLSLQTYRMIALCMESRVKVKESELKVKAQLRARRYSTVSIRSVSSSVDTVNEIRDKYNDDLHTSRSQDSCISTVDQHLPSTAPQITRFIKETYKKKPRFTTFTTNSRLKVHPVPPLPGDDGIWFVKNKVSESKEVYPDKKDDEPCSPSNPSASPW